CHPLPLRVAENQAILNAQGCPPKDSLESRLPLNVNPNSPHTLGLQPRPDLTQGGLRRMGTDYLLQIAMLGGYLARHHDPPPGTMVVWRGLTRLHDIAVGITIGAGRRCG
ncbi:hypothetical protein Q8W71_32845, partial [Methylobacterium sp. NEAU 140]|nr:hypothetical protein [Methylobacterium sp. NEAU 140]